MTAELRPVPLEDSKTTSRWKTIAEIMHLIHQRRGEAFVPAMEFCWALDEYLNDDVTTMWQSPSLINQVNQSHNFGLRLESAKQYDNGRFFHLLGHGAVMAESLTAEHLYPAYLDTNFAGNRCLLARVVIIGELADALPDTDQEITNGFMDRLIGLAHEATGNL